MDEPATVAPSTWAKKKIISVVVFGEALVIGFIFLIPLKTNQPPVAEYDAGRQTADVVWPTRGHSILDIHDENTTSGDSPSLYLLPPDHTNNYTVIGNRISSNVRIDPKTIAVGLGLTTRGVASLTNDNLQEKLMFFTSFLPSFCSTCSKGYKYNFFLAYDYNDKFLSKSGFLASFNDQFHFFTRKKCPMMSEYRLHFVRCDHTKSPAWAQNDAMMEAYLSNMAYYYRINDDTRMVTPGWTEIFIKTLNKMIPQNVGVVGPTHRGGNMAILTYDFVSHLHIEIFGFYYPRVYPSWYADGWITKVYEPNNSLKLKEIKLNHLMSLGQRYKSHAIDRKVKIKQLDKDKVTLSRYITSHKANITPTGRHIVSMSLAGKDPVDTWGAVWYAQHVTLYLPEWTLRVYIDNTTEETQVSNAVINKLVLLGAQVLVIPDRMRSLPSQLWRYLVIEDDTVDVFLIRGTRTRFTERESVILDKWLSNITDSPIYCVRDHTNHAKLGIVDGLWGASRSQLLKQIKLENASLVTEFFTKKYSSAQQFLSDVVLLQTLGKASCFDSVSCTKWENSQSFPVLRKGGQWVGQPFSQHGMAKKSLKSLPGSSPDQCNNS